MNRRLVWFLAIVTPILCLGAAGTDVPELQFSPRGVTVSGLKPGTRIAWMAMIRERLEHRAAVHIVHGVGPVTPGSSFDIDYPNAEAVRGLWVVADLSTGKGTRAKSPATVQSSVPIETRAVRGETSLVVASGSVELMYVRKNAAWTFGVSDGAALDGDGVANDHIVISLQTLKSMHGNPHPPDQIEEGDVILMIDPRGMRSSVLEVAQ